MLKKLSRKGAQTACVEALLHARSLIALSILCTTKQASATVTPLSRSIALGVCTEIRSSSVPHPSAPLIYIVQRRKTIAFSWKHRCS